MIRPAATADIDALVRIENRCFSTDRLSRRSFRHLLTRGRCAMLVVEEAARVAGYALVLFHRGTSLARLYSFAVDPDFQGRGLGRALLKATEEAAVAAECITLRLEVRRDNSDTIALYAKAGYRQFGVYPDYYEDHMEALRFEKRLVKVSNAEQANVPFYRQSLDFTCGPASLLMAMCSLDKQMIADRNLELRLWRESTTIFMTSGHGGCGPFGLALAAAKRGFAVQVYVNDTGTLFVDSVRNEEKKEVMRLVQEEFVEELAAHGVPVHYEPIELDAMREAFSAGAIPLVLISSWRIYREKFPHWVVVTGFDDKFIYVHDPFVDDEKEKSESDCVSMPIRQDEFARMARYGKSGLRTAVIVSKEKS